MLDSGVYVEAASSRADPAVGGVAAAAASRPLSPPGSAGVVRLSGGNLFAWSLRFLLPGGAAIGMAFFRTGAHALASTVRVGVRRGGAGMPFWAAAATTTVER